MDCSTAVFIRRFLHSDLLSKLDSNNSSSLSLDVCEGINSILEQFGDTDYGKVKYSKSALFWIGYMYRYISYTREQSTKFIMQLFNYRQMNDVYYSFHTQDPDYLEVIRGEVKAEKKKISELLKKNVKEYQFSRAEDVSEKIKAGTKWGGVAFVGILNAVDNYEEFGTIHSKRFWEETLLETTLDVVGGTLVSAIVGGLLAAAGISVAGIAIAAVTVGVMWAADVVCGYVQEAKGKESKRVTETISDVVLDAAKQ